MTSTEEHELNALVELFESRSLDRLVVAGKQYTKKYPQNGSGWNILALGYKNLGNIPEAIKTYEFLVKGAPKSAVFLSNLGNTYMMVGRVSEGIHCYERALELEPNLINAIEALGLAYLEIDQTNNAVSSFKRVISLEVSLSKLPAVRRYCVCTLYRREPVQRASANVIIVDS